MMPDQFRDYRNSYATNPMALQPWGLFDSNGFRIKQFSELPKEGSHIVLVYEGGQFLWPGIHDGFKYV